MSLARFDEVTKRYVDIPDDAVCLCCGQHHDESSHGTKLCLDHLNRRGGDYRTQVLCVSCNSKKGSRPYVSFPDGTCWYPGMAVGARVPKPRKGAV